jgi:hypothetical protein
MDVEYKNYCAEQIMSLATQMMRCNCEGCRTVSTKEKYSAIAQALVDATADHIFAGCRKDVEAGEKAMVDALSEAKKLLMKCYEEFEVVTRNGGVPVT